MLENDVEISYKANPPGQIGTRPKRIKRNSTFQFKHTDASEGKLTLQFINDSPAADGSTVFVPGVPIVAAKSGRFPFMCLLERGGTIVKLGDPSDPDSPAGGEIEIPDAR